MGGSSWLLAVARISTVKAAASSKQGDPSQTLSLGRMGLGSPVPGQQHLAKPQFQGGQGRFGGQVMGYQALIHLVPSAQRPAALQDELISIKSKPFPKSTCEGFSGCSCLISLPHSRSTGTVSVLSLSRACLAGSGNERRGGGGGGSRVCFVRQ